MKIHSCMPNNDMIDFWIKNDLNVLFFGRHGVGKTSTILEGFERNKVKFLQFSAATMDPWVDFIGVPKEMKDDKGSYLELIRPKAFRDDEVEALFFDELNRSHKKVRNAIMELIQFRSINGKKFPRLRMIWGAVNPEEDAELKYDVEKLDPAQADRFQIHIEIPYKPYSPYFREKYGRDISQSAISWWNDLPDNIKLDVSPRRLEYALQIYKAGGNLLHVLPPMSNVDKLVHSLVNGWPIQTYKDLLAEGDELKISAWISDENNYSAVKSEIFKNPENVLHLLSEEKICSLVSINNKIADYVFKNVPKFTKIIEELIKNSPNKKLQKRARESFANYGTKPSTASGAYIGINIKTALSITNATLKMNNYKWNTIPRVHFMKNKLPSYQLDSSLPLITQSISKNPRQTPERIRICNSVINIVQHASILSETEINTALSIIDWVASKTQVLSLIKKTANLAPTINKCVEALKKFDPNYKEITFINNYPNISGKLIAHNMTNNRYDWCIVP